ncbi:Cytokinin oxidase/dehydrogenase [Rhynchospora pubera]|uniref:cytokinin dehydrogenase n=1 Tax=Rhynchospora pubera TaxID=906938 RepID=A0AAV8FUX3_9POAL|nr:Cytokinin oxidase/dehydrogenase [Rhynchospora pubera]
MSLKTSLKFSLIYTIVIILQALSIPLASLPQDVFHLKIASKIRTDERSLLSVSTDFGNLTTSIPDAVLYPSSPHDISRLIRFSYTSSNPFSIAPRGNGHSLNGQAFAPDGVVIDMKSLGYGHSNRINVSIVNRYADVGGEQLWIDVLHETLKYGLTPRSWTDYLHLTVGGTLSVGGISGQTSRYGPLISNVHELDVITGKGEMLTCSKDQNSDLFLAVLGGMGQFGIITRARIILSPAPQKVHWIRLVYTDVVTFTQDLERLISKENSEGSPLRLFNYVEGSFLGDRGLLGSWRSPEFFTDRDYDRMSQLVTEDGLGGVYYIEGAVYYTDKTAVQVNQKLELLLGALSYVPDFAFIHNVSYVEFLDRVHDGELKLRELGEWEVPHPWLNLFVPKSRILDFDTGIIKAFLSNTSAAGIIIIYPMNRNKWDDRMSTMIPDEEIFYTFEVLYSASKENLQALIDENEKILKFCNLAGIKYKQYLPHYATTKGWMKHFGKKWNNFLAMKAKYDPRLILSPGSRIFSSY